MLADMNEACSRATIVCAWRSSTTTANGSSRSNSAARPASTRWSRPAARAAVERSGFLVPRRRRLGQRMMRVVRGWCAFFHQGCVLHAVGAAEGDKFRYKPALCALFPIQQDNRDRWYVRQKGYKRERWDLFCLDPRACAVPAGDSLRDEIALARRFDDEQT